MNLHPALLIKSSEVTKDSLARMLDHLKANEVDVAATNIVVGPLLNIDVKKELFTESDATIVGAAPSRAPKRHPPTK